MKVTVVVLPAAACNSSCAKLYEQHTIAIESLTGGATELVDAASGGSETSAKVAMCARKYLSDRVSSPWFPRGAGYSKRPSDTYPGGDIRNNFWTDIGYELAKKWPDTYPM